MKRNIGFVGIAGLIIFIFGLFTRFVVSYDQFFFWELHLLVGAILLGMFAVRGGVQGLGAAATKRAAGLGAEIVFYTVLFVALLALVNYLVSRHDPLHFDSTEQKVHTLSPQAQQVLASLGSPVIIRAFYVGGEMEPFVRELLDRLAAAGPRLKWERIDPEKKPALAQKYGVTERGTLHIAFDSPAVEREVKLVRTINEQELVNALLKLTRGGERTVYWLRGHGEANSDEAGDAGFLSLREAIKGENMAVKPLQLAAEAKVPEDASALLVMAPRKPLLPVESSAIKEYLGRGGSALFTTEPNTEGAPDVAAIVKPLGIELGADIILDQMVHLFSGPTVGVQPLVNKFEVHPITKDFKESVVFSTLSSVAAAKEQPKNGVVVELAKTSEKSWAEKNVKLVFSDEPQAQKEPEDTAGPVPVAAAWEGKAVPSQEKPGRVVVLGDADFVANVNIRQLFNRDFFLNALNWVVGEDQGVTIRPKTMRGSIKKISTAQFRSMFMITVVFLPELLLIFGFWAWWRRTR